MPRKNSKKSGSNEAKSYLRETGLFLLDILYNAVIIVVLVIVIRNFLISPFRVIGQSMADTLQSNEFILIDKLSYQLGEPKRGDAIVFTPPMIDKYPSKFEETLAADAEGKIRLNIKGMTTKKRVIYCKHRIIERLWFCQDEVNEGDEVFYRSTNSSSDAKDWENYQQSSVTKEEIKNQEVVLEGIPGRTYQLRIFDQRGPEYFVKRIIGIPGDTVKIDGGRVFLKTSDASEFIEINEPYLNSSNQNSTFLSRHESAELKEFTVEPGSYFVLGDNRKFSNDSRSWFTPVTHEQNPFVPLSSISGKVLIVLWPPDDIRIIRSADL